jgi:two-component SAPR family response regulator
MESEAADTIETNRGQVEIFTFGRFLIRRNAKNLPEGQSRSKKVWALFQYLLAQRGKAISPETILEALWPGQNYTDPNLALRSLVHRLRRLLAEGLDEPELALNIVFSQGGYKWDSKVDCWLDTDEFDRLCREAYLWSDEQPARAIDTYQKAIALYEGPFLPECSYHEWAIARQNYYHRAFLDSVYRLAELLKRAHRFSEIIEVCQKALNLEYFEEELHILFLEALLEEGKIKQARAHYDEVTSTFYRELGTKPSEAMRNIYRLIKMDKDNFDLDLTYIQEGLRCRQENRGALLCDPDVFRYFYKLERSRRERTGQAVFLGLLTITLPDYRLPAPQILKEAMLHLEAVLEKTLRKGDVISRWNEAQFLLILPGLNLEQAERVLKRVNAAFKSRYNLGSLVLHRKQQPLLPL